MDWGFDPDAPIESTRSIMTPYGEQDENGVDLSLIRSQLERTPLERMIVMDKANRDAMIILHFCVTAEQKKTWKS
jgi:hypothetical protein